MKVNEGEVPQYYVENTHPPIIQPDEWDRVQAEFQRRKAKGKNHNCNRLFSAQIVCGDCGEYYGSKVWHSNSKSAKWLMDENNLRRLAAAEAETIAKHYGLTKKALEASQTLYRVQIGAFSVRENAEVMAQRAKDAGFEAFVTTE